jgi:hypothetical protein
MKTLYIFLLIFLVKFNNAQIFADSQTNGACVSCAGCNVEDPVLAADGDLTSHSTINLTTGVQGANVYQTLKFSVSGSVGEIVGIVVEDTNSMGLNSALLSGVELTTYYNNSSNADTQNSTQFTIKPVSGEGNKYSLEFTVYANFDAVELKLNAEQAGGLNNLYVYYAYHVFTVLPVKLNGFTASLQSGSVALNWTVPDGEQNSFFVVERSSDGFNYEPVAVVNVKNAHNEQDYSITDHPEGAGIFYYKLKLTHFNGQSEMLGLVDVDVKISESDLRMYYNYQNSQLMFNENLKSTLVLELYALSGTKVICTDLHPSQKNNIPAGNLISGIYYYVLYSGNEILVSDKIVISN